MVFWPIHGLYGIIAATTQKTEGQSKLVGAKVETSSVGRDPTGTKSQETQMLRDA